MRSVVTVWSGTCDPSLIIFPMPFVAGHTAVIATMQAGLGLRPDTTPSGAATFLVCMFAPSLSKCFRRMCEEAERCGTKRRNRCDEKTLRMPWV